MMSQVNTELARTPTALINLGETAVRTLAGKPSGTINMSDLWGKSSGPALAWVNDTTLNQYSEFANFPSVSFNSDGTITKIGTAVNTGPTAYLTPTSGGGGSGYQVMITFGGGGGGPDIDFAGLHYMGGVLDGYSTPWYNLGTSRVLSIPNNTTNTGYQFYTVYIQRVSTGVTISHAGIIQWTN